MPAELFLQSVVPLGAVPGRLRSAVAGVLEPWGYGWAEVSFAGTAGQPAAEHRGLSLGPDEIWVFAVTTGSLALGDRLESAGSRAAGISLSAFSGGVIPVTPFQARVYEYLGGNGGGDPLRWPSVPPGLATTPETERAAPDQLR
jgi:hypothetical protein